MVGTNTAARNGDDLGAGIVAMRVATDRAEPIVEAVSEISAESSLLALNAAVEAARAGTRGLGFTVIADEIGRLARATEATTQGIAETIGKLRARGLRFEEASAEGGVQMQATGSAAQRGRAAVDDLRATVTASLERSRVLGQTAQVLGADAEPIRIEVAAARAALCDVGRAARERARIVLSDVLGAAHRLALERGIDTPIARMHAVLEGVTREIEAVYARAIASGSTTLDALRTFEYVELRGDEVAHLQRFVDSKTAPCNGFAPPKYRTAADGAVDLAVMAIFDRAMAADDRIASMGAFDLNGFAIALPSNVSKTTDWERNRAKRLLEDPIILRMVRVGLGEGAEASGYRRSWAAFARDGYALGSVEPRPWIPLAYLQDTGAVFITFGAAVFVEGVRVGTASLIVDAQRVGGA